MKTKTAEEIQDQNHGADCAMRLHGGAECTCGKADALAAAEQDPICACQGCDWEGPESKLKEIQDFHQRVDPGEECPAGECPECGCLAHIKSEKPETVSLPVAQASEIAKLKTLLAEAAGTCDEVAQWITGDESFSPTRLAESLTLLAADCRAAARGARVLKAVVEVTGGVAEVTECQSGVEVEIVDHDNERNTI